MTCTVNDIRKSNKKFDDSTEVLDTDLRHRIKEAEQTVEVDLSDVLTSAQITTIGNSSTVLNMLTLYKAVELSLVYYFGASRRVKDVDDVQYYSDMYNSLLEKVLTGKVKISDGTTDYTVKSYPKKTSTLYNQKFYRRKGVEGFIPDGADEDVKDDRFEN